MLRSSVFTLILVSQSLYASIELDYLNSLRTSTGLAPFTQQSNLDTAAQNHSICQCSHKNICRKVRCKKGALKIGYDADIVIFDENFSVVTSIVSAEVKYK